MLIKHIKMFVEFSKLDKKIIHYALLTIQPIPFLTLPKSPGRSVEGEEWRRGTGLDVAMEAGKDCGLARRTNI